MYEELIELKERKEKAHTYQWNGFSAIIIEPLKMTDNI